MNLNGRIGKMQAAGVYASVILYKAVSKQFMGKLNYNTDTNLKL